MRIVDARLAEDPAAEPVGGHGRRRLGHDRGDEQRGQRQLRSGREQPGGGHGLRAAARHHGRGHPRVPGHPVRGAAGREAALAAAAAGRAVGGRARRDQLRAALPAVGVSVRRGQHVRGLPVPERLRPGGRILAQPAGDGVDPRWRPGHRGERRLQPGCPGQAGRGRGHHQLPARRARLPGRQLAGQPAGRAVRRLRADRPAGRAALGAAEHPRVRRQPAQRDRIRRVGRRPVHAVPAGVAGCPWAVPARHRGERHLRADPGLAGQRRIGRRRVRGQGRLHQQHRRLPAQRAGGHAPGQPERGRGRLPAPTWTGTCCHSRSGPR